MLTEVDLRSLRQSAVDAHARWKQEILLCDEVAAGNWQILWPNLEVEESNPLVENIYLQALEDKTITAAAIPLMLHVPPTRGTRQDRGEMNAQKRRRVMLAYWEFSNLRKMRQRMFRDWYHSGVMAGNPWAKGFVAGRVDFREPAGRLAYLQTVNPRHLYPLAWDSKGQLAAGMIIRRRRVKELKDPLTGWGNHPTIAAAEARHKSSGAVRQLVYLEEIWYFDSDTWAVAIGDSSVETFQQGGVFGPADAHGNMIIDWLVAPSKHMLGSCPLKAVARTTHNDSPRGALVDVLPSLRTAQNFMARLLDDLNMSIYAPVALENIENPEEYGLGAVLIGNGAGRVNIHRDRPPVNFEAQQTVQTILDQTRRDAFEPAQRSGEAGASIVSAKGTVSLMGTFNAELAAAQSDAEDIITQLTSATAALDEVWCAGSKQVQFWDATGDGFSEETYDPAALFKSDWRCVASYGDRTGLDDNQHQLKLSVAMNLGGMSRRTYMTKAGLVDDPLAEETEMMIEGFVDLYVQQVIPQQVQAGNLEPMLQFIDLVDTDGMTGRQAMFQQIRDRPRAEPANGPAGPTTPQGRLDIIKMARSIGQGGIPGQAEGQPPSLMPGQQRRALAETAPGPSGP